MFALAAAMALAIRSAPPDVPPPDPLAVQEVKAGRRKVASAAWWGFDPNNATAAIQGAIDSGASKVIVPNVGRDWIVDPIHLASDQEIVFERGVVVAARKGGFTGSNDCLLKADRKRNLTVRGYMATLRMNKPEYTKGEWRHCLELDSCTNVKVLGLTLRDSGGDGIYIGNSDSAQPFCKDILVRDCTCDNNRRQGMSVITAVNLRVERCAFRNTNGTAPHAGVDLEPNEAVEKLAGCVFRDCMMENNAGPGILMYLGQLDQSTDPISVRFERCRVTSDKGSGIEVGGTRRDAPRGAIAFRGCTVERCSGPGLRVFNKSSAAVPVRFERCMWRDVERANTGSPPLRLGEWLGDGEPLVGGVEFVDCTVEDDHDRPFLGVVPSSRHRGVADVRGTIVVRTAHGARMALGPEPSEIDLSIRSAR